MDVFILLFFLCHLIKKQQSIFLNGSQKRKRDKRQEKLREAQRSGGML
jgi:heme exporter protein D